jgi:hypothetical protein
MTNAEFTRNRQVEQCKVKPGCRSSERSRSTTSFNVSGAEVSFPSELQRGFNQASSSNRGFLAPRKPQAARPPAGSSPVVHLAELQEQAILCGFEALVKAGRLS